MMNDGVIHRKTLTGDLSVIRFTSYAFDLSAFMSAANEVTLLPKDRTTQYLLNPSPNDKMFQRNPGEYSAELDQRFSEWSYSLVFALIALAVAGDARSHREARIHPLITAIVIALFVRWLGFFAAGKADKVPQYAYMVYRRADRRLGDRRSGSSSPSRTMELPVAWADWMTNLASRVGETWTALKLRLSRGAAIRPGSRLMGWTLGRYFFFRYVSITMWFFLGLLALVFLIDFTELSGRTTGLPGFTYGTAFAISALQDADDHAADGAVRRPVLGDGDAGVAQPQIRAGHRPLGRRLGLAVPVAVLHRRAAVRRAVGRRAQPAGRARLFLVRADGKPAARPANPTPFRPTPTPWIRQKTSSGDTIIGARAILNQGLEMADAVFFVARSARQHRRAQGRGARLPARRLLGIAGRQGASRTATIRSEATDRVATNLKPEFVQERLARPETIPFYDLPGKIEVARSFGLKANAFAMQFDSLVALPFLLVAMTLIAATVSMRFARMGQSATMILGGVLAGFLLYVVSVLVKAFGEAGFVPHSRGCMGSGCRGYVLRGDVPAIQGRRLVREAVLRSHRQAGLARLYGASALACLFACARPDWPLRWRRTSRDMATNVPSGIADAARGRHACLQQRRPDGDRRRRRADRLWRQQARRPARRVQPQHQAAGRQRQRRDRQQRRHQDQFASISTSPTISPTASSTRCASKPRKGLFRRRKRRTHGRRADDVPQWRLHGLRALRGQAGQGADLARQGAARSSGTARRRRFASRTRISSSSAFRSPICRRSRSPTRRSSARAAS